LAFGAEGEGERRQAFARVENLSAAGSAGEAAANLFAALHRLDAAGLETIYARTVPETGLGRAINDRLRKAAAAPAERAGR
jgi:L-threonylcarbamoyladenylate synthase